MRIPSLTMLALAGTLSAQSFTSSAVTATPLVANASVPGQPFGRTIPVGSTIDRLNVVATAGGPGDVRGSATAFIDDRFLASPSGISLVVNEVASATGQGQASIAAHDIDLTLQATVATPVQIRLAYIVDGTAPTLPVVDVDIGNDGTIEFQGRTSGQQLAVPVVVGSSPLVVQVRVGANQGGARILFTCAVMPAVRVTASQVQPACGAFNDLRISAELDQRLVFRPGRVLPAGVGFNVLALGFQQNPLVLPLGGCLLVPSADYLQFFAASHSVDLRPVPQRPLVFLAQSLHLDLNAPAFTTSETKLVTLQ